MSMDVEARLYKDHLDGEWPDVAGSEKVGLPEGVLATGNDVARIIRMFDEATFAYGKGIPAVDYKKDSLGGYEMSEAGKSSLVREKRALAALLKKLGVEVRDMESGEKPHHYFYNVLKPALESLSDEQKNALEPFVPKHLAWDSHWRNSGHVLQWVLVDAATGWENGLANLQELEDFRFQRELDQYALPAGTSQEVLQRHVWAKVAIALRNELGLGSQENFLEIYRQYCKVSGWSSAF